MDEQFEHSVDYELLGRYFSGECTPEESARAQTWIDASPDNRATYEALRTIWEQAEDPQQLEHLDTDAAWAGLSQRLGMEDEPRMPRRMRRPRTAWWRIAAVLVVVTGLGLIGLRYLNQPDNPPQMRMLAFEAGDTPRTDTLPDGSVVTLNAHAKLQYPEQFASARREVELEGEAFFEVQRKPEQPFVIHAGAADVRVLGTSFSVRRSDSLVEVVVATGKVELSAPEDTRASAAILTAGQRGDYHRKEGRIVQEENQDENFLYWKNHRLVFRSTPLAQVVIELEALLGTKIRLKGDKIASCPLTTTFENQSIESILNIIAETFNLEMTQDANTYTLSGGGC